MSFKVIGIDCPSSFSNPARLALIRFEVRSSDAQVIKTILFNARISSLSAC